VTVSGAGSKWDNSDALRVGNWGNGTLEITNGAVVKNTNGYVGYEGGSTGAVTVSGGETTWSNSGDLYVGFRGEALLTVEDDGLVSVGGGLTIDKYGNEDSFINMGVDGMLALHGNAGSSMGLFLGLIDGTDAIRYWDGANWADITGATPGVDYTLRYQAGGDLAGYTLLTMGIVLDPPTPGDTDGDHDVDELDLANLVAQFGGPPDAESADFTGNVFVGLEDFAIMRDNYGFGVPTAPNAGPAATTPEPATLILLAGGLPLLLKRHRKSGRQSHCRGF
jgi:T5SS/PEP-CTERM-associated repeat protein